MRLRPLCTSILATVIVALGVSPVASAWTTNNEATRVASIYAERTDVTVRCFSEDEAYSPSHLGAWGYTMPLLNPIVYLDGPTICAGIDAIPTDDPAVEDWKKAIGVLVLTHEAYHLRHWRWWRSEGRVECQAIRHWRYTVRMLGGTTAQADRLFPWALEAHYHLISFAPEYNYDKCVVPGP